VRIDYHPAVQQDVADALQRYDAVSRKLGEEFKAELRRVIAAPSSPADFTLPNRAFDALT
jgi:hypothetical protein